MKSKIPVPFIVIMVAVVALIAYFVTTTGGGAVVQTEEGVVVSAPTDVERLEKALATIGSSSLGFDAADRVQKRGGKLLVDDPAKLKGVPEGVTVAPLLEQEAIKAALLTRDESAAAAAMREAGVSMVAVHHRVGASLDRGNTVLAQLFNHDHLEFFSLFWVSEGVFLYEVRESPVGFNPRVASASVQYLRARMKGQRVQGFPDFKSETGQWELAASLRTNGEELAVAFARDKTLSGALEELVVDLERGHRRNSEPLGFPPLARHLEDVTIELHRVTERAYIEPRDEEWLERYWEMGVDGAYVLTPDKKERGVLPGAAAYTRSLRTADSFLRAAAKVGRMSDRRPWRDPEAWLESYRTVHYREDPDTGLAFLYRGVPAVPLERVSVEAVRQGVVAAGDWYLGNLLPNGQVIYKMWPSENRYASEYNLVRHTLATWNLVQAWEMDNSRDDFLKGAQRALDFTQQYLVREPVPGGNGEMMAYYTFNENQKLGTVVVNMLGMIDLARATDDHSMDEQLIEMGRFVLFMQDEQGGFNGYYVNEEHSYYGQQNDIVPGEAALALVFMAEYFDDDEWIATLPKYWEYYYDWFPKRVEKADWDAPWPAHTYDNDTRLELVQFGPWTVMAANAYTRRVEDPKVVEFGLEIARWMIDAYQWDSERAPFPDYVGGYYKLPGELPAMQAFCYAEGTAAAYVMALREKPEEAAYFQEKTRQTLRFGLQMQYYPQSTYAFTRPQQVMGGIRYAMNETKVRVDYVHHGLSAMYQWVQAAKDDPGLDPAIKTGPPLPMQVTLVEPEEGALGEDGEPARPKLEPSVRHYMQQQEPLPLPVRLFRRDPEAPARPPTAPANPLAKAGAAPKAPAPAAAPGEEDDAEDDAE